jgi:hypothetical protein
MPKFKVEICRIGYGFNEITVDADCIEEAKYKALEQAGDLSFSEKSSDYEVNFAVQLERNPSKGRYDV